jgi:hypothetical protein
MSEPPQFFEATPHPSPITEFALQVTSSLNDEGHYASGTAVIVAPILAFAARHVLDEHWLRHEGRPMPTDGEIACRFSLLLFQVFEHHTNAWAVTRLWTSPISDIVLLRLQPWSDRAGEYKFKHLTIDLLPPKIGDRISAFGYHKNKVIRDGNQITFDQRGATTHGNVVEVHHEFRDKGFLRFPCFRTNARFEGGMSGGPVFNSSHQLCGLVCAALPPLTPEDEHTSYAVALWPAMAIPIDLDRLGHPQGVRYLAIDLVRDNILVARNADRVSVGDLDPNGTATIAITIPEETSAGRVEKGQPGTVSPESKSED